MDQRERANPYEESLLALLDGRQASIWTALPGELVSFDAEKLTCQVQPTIQAVQLQRDGSSANVTLPLLVDCPVIFPQGGGVVLTLPLAEGDEVLVVFSSRCIDAVWQSGGVQPQAEFRMHDLSDGFVLAGWRNQTRLIENVSTTAAQLRSDDGSTLIELDPEAQSLTLTAPGGITINGDITHNGSVVGTGSVDYDGEGTFNGGHTVSQHTHTQPADSHGDTEQPTNKPTG